MSFAGAVRSVLGQYVTFTGRATRPEFWWWMLFTLIVDIAASILDAIARNTLGFAFIGVLLSLGLFLPTLAVSVRRLHDSNLSGWWVLLPVGASIAGVVLLIAGAAALLADAFSEGSSRGPITGVGLVLMLVGGLLGLAGLVAQLILMLRASTPGPNRFGPPTGAWYGYPYPPQGPSGYGPDYPPTW